ncbi:MAG TPA: hypothetical protein VNB64_02850, partial [Solirubrobacteraceae bacterium]|nr:hypothetical protein [Solirubrobacteraceae bacterium]
RGLVVGARRRDAQRSLLLAGDALSAEAIGEAFAALAERTRAELEGGAAGAGAGDDPPGLRATYELRYRGQAFELPVEREGDEPASPDDLRAAFAAAHEERYGYADDEAQVELVTLRVTAVTPGAQASPGRAGPGPPTPGESPPAGRSPAGTRPAVFDGQTLDAAVWRGSPVAGARIEGPAVCELPESTLVVPPGWAGEVDPTGAIRLEAAG